MLQRQYARSATGQDDVWPERDQFRRISTFAVDIVRAPAGVNPHIAAVAPAQSLQGLLKRREGGLTLWIVSGPVHKHTDMPHLLGLLRARIERPCSRSTA